MFCSQKEGALWKQTTHTPSDVDPGVYVLQIGLTPTDSFPFPKLKLLPALPDSSMIHRLTEYVHPRQLKQFLPSAVHKKKEEGPIVPPCTVLPLPNSSCLFLQQELNSTSDAAENSQYS
jgi:hypothetical protein